MNIAETITFILQAANTDQWQALDMCNNALQSFTNIQERAPLLILRLTYTEYCAHLRRKEPPYVTAELLEPQFIEAQVEFMNLRRELREIPWMCEMQAQLAHALGNYELHDSLLDAGAADGSLSADLRLTLPRFGEPDTSRMGEWLGRLPVVQWAKRLPSDARSIVFFTCGPEYFLKFGEGLLASLAKNAPDCVHVHVQDHPAPAAIGETVAQKFGDRCGVSFEEPGLLGDTARFYYAGNRLVRLHQFGLPAPTLFLDTDTLACQPLQPIFDRLSYHDVLLCRMRGRWAVHSQINATVNAWNNTPAARTYLERVAGLIGTACVSGLWPWGIDQIALWVTFVASRRGIPGLMAAALGPSVYDGGAGGIILPQKVSEASPLWESWRTRVLAAMSRADP